MNNVPFRRIAFFVGLLFLLVVSILLIGGSEWLVWPIWDDPFFPLGTLLTWLFVVVLPATILLGVSNFHPPQDRFSKRYWMAFLALVGLAASWGGVAYALAGNWNFSFRGDAPTFRGSSAASPYFWRFTYALLVLPILLLLVYKLHDFFRRGREQK